MGGFLGIGGSSAKTDRKTQLGAYGDLENIFSYALPAGKAAFGAGQQALGKSLGYFQQLLSGNRPAMQQAVAPEVNAATATSDAAKRQAATSGTARGGGTAAAGQTRQDALMAQIDNMLFGLRPQAAGAVADIGKTELGAGERMLGLGESAATNLGSLAAESRKTSYAINRQTQDDVLNAIGTLMSFIK